MRPKEARDLVKTVRAEHKTPAERSRQQYERSGPRLVRELEDTAGGLTQAGLLERARARGWKKQTILSHRSALVHELTQRTEDALRAYNRADKGGRKEEARQARADVAYYARALDDVRAELPDMKREPKNSARRRLRPAQKAAAEAGYSDWRVAASAACRDADRDLASIMAATGCRPAELDQDHGVLAWAEGDKVAFRIHGAKVNEAAGQPSRVIRVSPDKGPIERGLYDKLKRAGRAVEYQIAPDDTARAFSERLKRAASAALGVRIETYAYRHQAVSDWQASGVPKAQIAAALGHSTDECQRQYGVAELGSGGRGIEAEADREVAHAETGFEKAERKAKEQAQEQAQQRSDPLIKSTREQAREHSGPEHGPEMKM